MKSTSNQEHDAPEQLELFKRFAWPPLVDVEDSYNINNKEYQGDVLEDPPAGHEETK